MANAMPEYGGTVLRPGASGPDIALVQRWLGGLNVDGRYGTYSTNRLHQEELPAIVILDSQGVTGRAQVILHLRQIVRLLRKGQLHSGRRIRSIDKVHKLAPRGTRTHHCQSHGRKQYIFQKALIHLQ